MINLYLLSNHGICPCKVLVLVYVRNSGLARCVLTELQGYSKVIVIKQNVVLLSPSDLILSLL